MPATDGGEPIAPIAYDLLSRKQIVHNLRRNVPRVVRELKSFVVFKFAPPKKPGGKRNKVPFYVVSGSKRFGEQGKAQDRKKLVGFAEAVNLLEQESKWAGIGACAIEGNDVFFIDIDNCIDQDTGEINATAAELLRWRTYTELSPSGKGLRMVLTGNPGINSKNHALGLELFCTKGFVTLTGMPFGGKVRLVKEPTPEQLDRLYALLEVDRPEQQDDIVSIPSPLTKERYRDAKRALRHIDPDCSYHDWILVGQALHSSDSRVDGKGYKLWLTWSSKGEKFADTNEEEMLRKWKGFKAGRGVTISGLFGLAKESGFQQTSDAEEQDITDAEVHKYGGDAFPEVQTNPLVQGLFDNYGAYVFIGRAKIGKSRILGALVAAALCGGEALGFKFLRPCRVLALTLEEEPAVLGNRIRAYAVEPADYAEELSAIDDKLALKAAKQYSENFEWTTWLDILLRKLKPDFVYLDTAIKMRMLWQNDPEYRTKNVTEQDYQNASWLDQAAQKHRCVIVSVIHGSKRKNIPQHNFDPFESIGTTSWTLAGCTGALVLMDKPGVNALEDADDGQRVFSVRGRYMAVGDKHYTLQSNPNGTFSNLGEYHAIQATTRQQEYLQTILDLQNEGAHYIPARTVSGFLGVKEGTVKRTLHRFMEHKETWNGMRLIAKTGSGYRLVVSNDRDDGDDPLA